MKLRKDQDKLDSLQQTAKTVATKQNDLEATLKADNDEDEDEKRRRLEDLENLLKQKQDLKDVEESLETICEELEVWRDFQWSEAEEAELNRFGMISSLAMPSFPAGLVKDPALLAAITKRHQELLQIRRKLAAEEARMKEICAALEEMELRQVKFFLNIQIFYANISSARRSCGGWRRSLRSGCTTCSPRARRCSGPSPASSLTSA